MMSKGTHRPPIPVTVLTGFLGAGKTTLVNRILTDDHSLRLGVIVNEFGEIGIDGDLIVSTEESVIEVANGCVCCTVRDDLGVALREIASAEPPVEHIVIETTGLAAPGPVIQTFFVDDELREGFELDGIVTVVDAKTVALHLADSAEARDQIAFADVVVLNKADLVSPSRLQALEGELRDINGMARMHRTERALIDVRDVLDVGGFDLDRALDVRPELLADDAHGSHDALVSSVAFELPGELSGPKFYGWMRDLLLLKWRDLYRMKGIIALQGHDERIAFQGVHMLVDMRPAGPWGEAERGSRIVFIGRDLHRGALERGLLVCR